MTALTADIKRDRKGSSSGAMFGYPVAAGEKVFAGSLLGITSGKAAQRFQTSGSVAFIGIAERNLDNTAGSAVSDISVNALLGTYQITVPSAAAANIGAPVYVTDDNAVTLTQSGSLVQCGIFVGFDETGRTFVKFGS